AQGQGDVEAGGAGEGLERVFGDEPICSVGVEGDDGGPGGQCDSACIAAYGGLEALERGPGAVAGAPRLVVRLTRSASPVDEVVGATEEARQVDGQARGGPGRADLGGPETFRLEIGAADVGRILVVAVRPARCTKAAACGSAQAQGG